MVPWRLQRSPLAPGVPLEGSETVEGLRTLERLRLAELLQQQQGGGGDAGGGRAGGRAGGSWQRAFQRYRGPFIEQLGPDDLKQDPKSWSIFWKGSERGQAAEAYNLPASLAVLHERTEVSEWSVRGCGWSDWKGQAYGEGFNYSGAWAGRAVQAGMARACPC